MTTAAKNLIAKNNRLRSSDFKALNEINENRQYVKFENRLWDRRVNMWHKVIVMIGEKHGKNYSDENDMQEMRLEKFSIFSIYS